MHLLTLGLNHRTAPVALREQAAFTPDQLAGAVQSLASSAELSETAILSTCNRPEIYAACDGPAEAKQQIADFVAGFHGIDIEAITPHLYDYHGADAVRWFMLSDSPPERDLPWSEAGIEGCSRFVHRLWRLFGAFDAGVQGTDQTLDRHVHKTVQAVAGDIESLGFNKAVARIYELTGAVEKAQPSASRSAAIRTLVQLVAPMMPHLAEEAWATLGETGLVADADWPTVDPTLLVDDEVTIAVQHKGKLRDTLTAPKGASKEDLEAMALASEKVQRSLDGAEVRKVIVVPDRLVNIVT